VKVGILFNLVDEIQKGNEIDKLADNEVLQTAHAVKNALSEKGLEVVLIRVDNKGMRGIRKQIKEISEDVDFIFNLAEGIDGDVLAEPKIAAAIKKAGIPFSGSDEKALAVCLDKVKAKEMFIKNGILTPDYQVLSDGSEELKPGLSFPLIVKPMHEDGSIGITMNSLVKNDEELRKKVLEIIDVYKQPALVEEYIDGREINASIIGKQGAEHLEILPLSEIQFKFSDDRPRIVSFEAKWLEDSEEYKKTVGVCPVRIPKKVEQVVIETAKKAFRVMGCDNYSRVDFRIRDNVPYVLEVNPNPCINPEGAGFIRSAAAAGYSYNQIIQKIFDLARENN
jgi:D-alanine-D-alanine ligase